MWQLARGSRSRALRLFGPASIAVGVSSLVYHASYTYFFQFFDFVGMFMFAFLIVVLNSLRLGWFSDRAAPWVWAAGVLLFSALVPVLTAANVPIQLLVLALIMTSLVQEALLVRRSRALADYRVFAVALALITVAATCSAMDLTRIWCDPSDHWLQGHAVWHVLTALSLMALYVFYVPLLETPVQAPEATTRAGIASASVSPDARGAGPP